MSKYDELAQAIVDYEEIGHYDLLDAYDTVENALECIANDLRRGNLELIELDLHYVEAIRSEDLSDEAKELARRVIRLANELACERFVNMVNTYRALGYRIVEFEPPYQEDYGSSSWICAFDTHGVNADELPIEVFANEFWLEDLRDYASWNGPVSEVWHKDMTDDLDEMLSAYDYYANYPVMQLAE